MVSSDHPNCQSPSMDSLLLECGRSCLDRCYGHNRSTSSAHIHIKGPGSVLEACAVHLLRRELLGPAASQDGTPESLVSRVGQNCWQAHCNSTSVPKLYLLVGAAVLSGRVCGWPSIPASGQFRIKSNRKHHPPLTGTTPWPFVTSKAHSDY